MFLHPHAALLPCCLVLVTDILQPKVQRVGYSSGSKRGIPGAPPKDQNVLNFMQFLENLANLFGDPSWRVGAPPTGNPGSAPGLHISCMLTRYKPVEIPSQRMLHIIMIQLLKKTHVLQSYAQKCKSCSSTVRPKRALQGYLIVQL